MNRFAGFLRRMAARLTRAGGYSVSSDYRFDPENPQNLNGWTGAGVAERQHQAFMPLIHDAKTGKARRDFRVAAEAIAATGESDPLVLEVGCGSGYYSEILPMLLGGPVRYIGLDYSHAMIEVARKSFPDSDFVTGDALALPVATASCDICLSGTSLMHIPDYRTAIAEMVRVSRRWCVFHTVPVMQKRQTTVMSKRAYGAAVAEIVFNQREIELLFARSGLEIRESMESFPYDLHGIVGEPTLTLTYLCEKRA